MTAFLILGIILTLLVITGLLLPLVRRRKADRQDADEADLAAYRDRLAELQRERDRGALEEQEWQSAVEDLERELLQTHTASEGGVPQRDRSPARGSALAIAILLPLGGLVLYTLAGHPDLLSSDRLETLSGQQIQRFQSMPAAQRVEQLEDWLADNEGSARAWGLLAQAYRETEAYGDAASAFARAREAGANDAWIIARQAEAQLLANGRRFTRGVTRLLEEARARDARNPLALMLSGQAALVGGDPASAVEYWRQLVQMMPEEGHQRDFIEEQIARAEAAARGEAPGSADAGATEPDPAESRGDGAASITVEVSLADALAADARAEDTLFVFARSPDGGGPPLAVERTRVGALPKQFVLDDADAMAPQFKLSGAERVVVTARVSRSGQATRQSGDLEGSSDVVSLDGTGSIDGAIEIVIDQRVP